jgi:hypothetical protein
VNICIRRVKFPNSTLDVLIRVSALKHRSKLIQHSCSTRTDFKPLLDELSKKRQNLREELVAYLGLLLKLADVEPENDIFNGGCRAGWSRS